MNNKVIIWTIVIVVILAAAGVWAYNRSEAPADTTDMSGDMGEMMPATSTPTSSTPAASNGGSNPQPGSTGQTSNPTGIKTFTVSGQNFSFTPSTITVNKGDAVKIIFKNSGGMHDLRIDAFNVTTPVIGSGKEASVQFVASKTGTFEYYCSVGNHRAMGMFGTLIVK